MQLRRTLKTTWLWTFGLQELRICRLVVADFKNYEVVDAVADFKNYAVANLRLRTLSITKLRTCGYGFKNSETSLRKRTNALKVQ